MATAVLWVRSYWVTDHFQYWHTRWGIEVSSNWGEMSVQASTASDPYDLGEGWGDVTDGAERFDRLDGLFIGFGRTWVDIEDHDGRVIGREPMYWCPHWALVVLSGMLPAVVIAPHVRRRRRSRAGCCGICGYDRRASVRRCPECGKPIKSGNPGDSASI